MIINKSDVLNQFDDYREIISKATNLHLSLKKESKTFLRVYVLWSLSKRPELEKWLHNSAHYSTRIRRDIFKFRIRFLGE